MAMKHSSLFRPVGIGWWVDPRIERVRVTELRSYLIAKGWKIKTQPRPELLLFERESTSGETTLQPVPTMENSSDYLQRVIEVITGLAATEQRYAVEILEEVLQPS